MLSGSLINFPLFHGFDAGMNGVVVNWTFESGGNYCVFKEALLLLTFDQVTECLQFQICDDDERKRFNFLVTVAYLF